MDFTSFNAALAQLGTDVSAEIAAAVAAITAAQANPSDVTNLANAVIALNNIDGIVNAATASFGTNTGTATTTATTTTTATSTSTVPPPPVV